MFKWLFKKRNSNKKNMTYLGFRNDKLVISNSGGFIPIYKLGNDIAIDGDGNLIDISYSEDCNYLKPVESDNFFSRASLKEIYAKEISEINYKDFTVMAKRVGNTVAIMKNGTSTPPMSQMVTVAFFKSLREDIKIIHRV